MKKISKITFIALWSLLIILAGSCSENVLDENPPHEIAPDNLYLDLTGFEAGLNGAYALVRDERAGLRGSRNDLNYLATFVGTDVGSGNFPRNNARVYDRWGEFNNPAQVHFNGVWEWLYETVNAVNTIIERAENPAVDWTEEEKNRVIAEASLIRAWAYRHLTFLWGDVPMTLNESTGTTIRTDWERTPVAQVRAQMEKDLLFAEQHLPTTSPNPGKVVKGVAQHYLAELYLTMNENLKAKNKAQELINSGTFSLITQRYGVRANHPGVPFMDMFYDGNSNRSEGNTEALWVFQYQFETIGGDGTNIHRKELVNRYDAIRIGGVAPLQAAIEFGGRSVGRAGATRYMLELYEPGDDRGSEFAWRWYYTINNQAPAGYELGDTLYLPIRDEAESQADRPSTRKWENAVDPPNIDISYNDQIYLRLADTYLLLAEAQFKLAELGAAAETINILRRRASASEITAADLDLDFILDERARELYSEEHRRYVLVRNDKWLERTRLYNKMAGPNVTERDKLLPIPQFVIDANIGKIMNQNPGYSAD